MNAQLILINISGQDHPGITAEVMKCIGNTAATIEDMGQSIIHGLLSLSILIATDISEKDHLLKELLYSANQMDMQLDFKEVESHELIKNQGDAYILSCVALSGITSHFIKDIAATFATNKINIQKIDNVQEGAFKCLDMTVYAQAKDTNWDQVKTDLMTVSNSHETDMALIRDDVWRRNKRLIVFDMDSTLIQSEVIVEMAKEHGAYDKVHEITERAMNGELNFDQSLTERVKLLEGLSEEKLSEIFSKIKLTEGVEEFIQTLKSIGYKTAIISGGFQYFANKFKDQLGIDYAFANEIEIENGKLTGKVTGPIVNAEKKAMLLEMLAQQEGIHLEQVVAIGDGANDLNMLAKAGLGIAFHAKEIVKKNAQQNMSHGPMTTILYFLGLSTNSKGQ